MDKVVVFDGVCALCNKALSVLMKIDKNQTLRYSALQGEYVKTLDINKDIDSIVFYEEGKLYYKSTAILRILRSLGGVWILINIFYIIPAFMRDTIYDTIAKHRYKIFGKMDSCRMPNKEEAVLFID